MASEEGNAVAGVSTPSLWLRRGTLWAAAILFSAALLVPVNLRVELLQRTAAARMLENAWCHLEFEREPHFLEAFVADAMHLRPLRLAEWATIPKPGETIFSEELWAALAEFPECRRLFIRDRAVHRGAGKYLWRFRRLVDLELDHCSVDDGLCREIAKLPELRYLCLAGSPDVGDAGVLALRSHANLASLNLGGTGVGDAVTAEPLAPNVQALDLAATIVTPAGLAKLARWPMLRRIGVYGLPIKEESPEEVLLRAAGKEPDFLPYCAEPYYGRRPLNPG